MALTDYLLSPSFFIIKCLYFWYIILCACVLSHFSSVRLFVTLWTVAYQAPLSRRFSRQEYWSGLSWPPPGDLPNPGIEPRSPTLQADSLPLVPPGNPGTSSHLAKILQVSFSFYFDRMGFPGGSAGKESACNAGDLGSIPGLGRSPGEGKGCPLQYSGLENSVGSPWGRKELDTTERLSLSY